MSTPRATVDEQVRTFMFGTEFGDSAIRKNMEAELRERLTEAERERRPLKVYAGYDPSKPDLHLGHSLTLRKLRQFSDLGHDVTFLIGSFTAQVGDTSDKAAGRPQLREAEVLDAARTYAEQAFKILDRSRTRVAYNHEWLSRLTMADVVSLASNFTVQQFLARDNYRLRIEAGSPVGLHEFLYALLQGYDALHLEADVQLGASEQLFNILAGRKLQQAKGLKPCVCLTYPILVGTDGHKRMSKSTGNTVALAEPPDEQYGKVMSVSDETMLQWIRYVTRWPVEDIEARAADVKAGRLHPMELKKALAREVVAMYHGDGAADAAQRRFESVHQQHQRPVDAVELKVPSKTPIIDVLCRVEGVKSRNDARRLILGSGVKLDGAVVSDPKASVDASGLLQVGRHRFVRVVVEPAARGAA